MKRVIRYAAVWLLCLGLLAGMTSARSSVEIRKELDALKVQEAELAAAREKLEAELAANAGKTGSVIEEKSALDRQIGLLEAELRNAEDQIRQHSLLIAQKQTDLEAARLAQEQLSAAYKARLRAMEENGSVSYWSILFKASSFSDLLDRVNMIREVAEADQRMLAQLTAAAETIAIEQQALQQAIEAQKQVILRAEETGAELAVQRQEADQLLIRLKEEEAQLSEDFQAAVAEEDALRAEVMKAQTAYENALSAEEAARLAQQNKDNAAGGGTGNFLCPLPAGAWVTDAYGYRNHPLYGYYQLHTGVDLAANQGTEIYATAAGTVTRADYTKANGNYVALAHGGGYGSIYLHMTHYVVQVGDSVKAGQVIGYVGSTGWSSGPHLHFEIHKDGTAVNPMEYITLR